MSSTGCLPAGTSNTTKPEIVSSPRRVIVGNGSVPRCAAWPLTRPASLTVAAGLAGYTRCSASRATKSPGLTFRSPPERLVIVTTIATRSSAGLTAAGSAKGPAATSVKGVLLHAAASRAASPASTYRTRFAQLVLTALPCTCGLSAAPAAGCVEALLEELNQTEIRHDERD